MLTGCRLSEIQKLRREPADFDVGAPRFPDTNTSGRVPPLAPSVVKLPTRLGLRPGQSLGVYGP